MPCRHIGTRLKPSASEGVKLAQDCFGMRAAGAPVGDDADAVAARHLLARQIEHVAEQAADRRAKHVQNVQGSACASF